ncbi:MAG: polysaccharide deacetylase family protein [Gemmatimonadota bacterium]
MASGWKRGIEIVLARSGAAAAARWANGPSTVILSYHNIVPTGASAVGDRSLHIDQAAFGAHLDLLQTQGDVVGLSSLSAPAASRSRRPRIVITFDDAYRGTMTAGVDELERRGLPGTVFVPPGLLGSTGFWWDLLTPIGADGLDPHFRDRALNELEGRGDKVMAEAGANGLPIAALPSHAVAVEESELLDGGVYDGVTFAAHTWSHANLSALSREDARNEMQQSQNWLASRSDRYVDWFSYPYGLFSPSVVEDASMFEGALRVDGGLAERRGAANGPPNRIPRVNVPRGLSLEGLALRIAGVLS